MVLEYRKHIAIITINRTLKRNAFDLSMWEGFEDVVKNLKENLPRVIIITGAGDEAFSAGFDVNPENPQVASLIEAVGNHDREPVHELVSYIRKTVDSFVNLPVPIIAAMNGIAYGGGAELALRCDLRIMDSDAVICFSEVTLGLMPDWGGGVALSKLVGPSIAADIILTARKVKAKEAMSLGIVNRISKNKNTLKDSIELAEDIAENGPHAVRAALKVIRESPGMSMSEALTNETEIAATLISEGECVHGITAFLNKKKPEFPDI